MRGFNQIKAINMDQVAQDVFIHFKLETVQVLEMNLKLSSLQFSDTLCLFNAN